MDIDQCLDKVSGYRRYSLAAFFVMGGTVCITWACQGFLFVFIGRTPQHYCAVPYGTHVNESIPIDENTGDLHKCKMYTENSTNVTTSCDYGWDYINVDGDYTIVNEWDLVCDRSFLPEMSMMIFGVGGMIGESVGNIISDKFGRKWVHLTGFVVILITGSITAAAQSFEMYVALVFFSSLCNAACLTSAFTQLFEFFDSKRRAFVGMGIEYMWVFGYMYVAVIGYFVRNWRHLQLVLSLSSALGLFNVLFPESPIWLLANHKYKEAEAALQQMAKWNGVHVEGPLLVQGKEMEPLKEKLKKEPKKVRSHENGVINAEKNHRNKTPPEETGHETILDLFRWPLLFKFTVISSMLWFANSNVYYFMILSTPSLAGDFYLNFFMGCIVEIPAYTVAILVIKRGRRIPSSVFLILAAIALIGLACVQYWAPDVTPAIVFMGMFGKFSISASFAVIILYTRELFPTNLRGTSFGVGNLVGRVGMLVAPYASYQAKSVPWIPNGVLGLIALAVGLACLLLPETKDWPLPMSIADVYRFTRGEIPSSNLQKDEENDDETA